MAIIKILQYPNPRLKTYGYKVEQFDGKIQQIIDDMFETHYASKNCAALAATQLDITPPPHITVIDFSDKKNQPLCLVNAEILSREGETNTEEGCMSLSANEGKGVYAKVKRAEKIHVRAQDRHGKVIEFEADGFMAKCIQHELDHLDGKLFIDRLSMLKRKLLLEQLKKQKKR